MKVFDNKHIKNIVLLGSHKSGKTTLSETMLYEAGLINRRGAIENHNTVSDYHSLEHERESSVYTTLLHTEWRNYKINILDTPGLDDFIGEIISSVRVADTCVYLINAQHGVEVGTELIWNQVDSHRKPTIFVVNQLDHPKSDFDQALTSLKQNFGSGVTPMQYPVNEGQGFNGIIDLLKMKYYLFSEEGGKPEKRDIPDYLQEKTNTMHNELVEKAAENDEALMELYFDKGTLTEDEMRKGLRLGMLNHDVFPVFCISAKNDMGSGRLMGFIDNVAPSAIDAKAEYTVSGEEIPREEGGPAEIFVFKTRIEPSLGQITFFKVINGSLKAGTELINQQTGQTERLNQLFIIDGHTRNEVASLNTGDLGATLKLKNTSTNHTLASVPVAEPVAPMEFPSPRLVVAISATNRSDEEKLGETLSKLITEDPTINVAYSSELQQLLLGCQGELHLSVIKWILQNIYGLDVVFETPKISYRETIQSSAECLYRHKKQSGGAGQFAEVLLTVMPYYEGMDDPSGFNIRDKQVINLEWGGKLVYYNCIVGGSIDNRFHPSILKGIMEVMANGPVTGSYVRDVCVLVHDGKMHPVDSNDIAFKLAGGHAFKEAILKANPAVLEPVNELEVYVPEDLLGEVMTDLQTRRSIITGIDIKGNYQVINAKTPVSELDKYTTSLRSITQGRSSFKSRFSEYQPVSSDNISSMAMH